NGSAKRRFSAERREIAGTAAAANVGGEVVAENTAGIGKAVGIFAGGGVEEHANGFLRLRAENDGASREFVRLASNAVDIEQAASAIRGGVHENFVDHGVGNERAGTGVERVRNRSEGRVEIGMCNAAAFAWTAVVARAAAVDRAREVGGTSERNGAVER